MAKKNLQPEGPNRDRSTVPAPNRQTHVTWAAMMPCANTRWALPFTPGPQAGSLLPRLVGSMCLEAGTIAQ